MKMRPRSQLNISSKNFIKEKRVYFIIAAIVLFYLINNFIWLRQNTYPSGPDEAVHLTISLKYFKSITSNIRDILPSYPPKISGYWPPLFYISSAILNLFSGTSHISSVMINIPYLIILLFSVYLIGLKLFDRNTGISAMMLISMYPMIFRYSRFFVSDLALTAMVCLSICLLLYTEHFKKRKFSILFGFSLGLGMLIKWSFILFLIGPLIYTLFQILLLKIKQTNYIKQQVFNFTWSLIIGILISSSWYLSSFPTVIRRIKLFVWGTSLHNYTTLDPGLSARAVFQSDKFFKQLLLLINEQISLLFFVVFLITLFFYFLRRKKKLVLILWFVIPYLVLSLSVHKEGRYMLPSLPALALISGAGFQSIVSKRRKYFLYSTVMLLGLVQFFDISYNPYRKEQTFPFGTPFGPVHLLCSPITEHRSWSYGPPFKKDFKIERIANPIAEYYKYIPDSSSPVIVIIREDIFKDNYTSEIFRQPHILNYYLAKEDNRIDFLIFDPLQNLYILDFVSKLNEIDCIVFISKNNTWPKFDDLKKRFNKSLSKWKRRPEYLKSITLGKTPIDNIDTFFIEDANKRLKEFLSNKDKEFHLIKEIELLDGYCAYIYAKEDYLLKNDLLSLAFFKGRAGLWYKDKKITVQDSIKTIFRCRDKAYISTEALWQVKKLSNNILEARGTWQDLPGITQIWRFELMNGKEIRCQVDLENKDALDILDIKEAIINVPIPQEYRFYTTIEKRKSFLRTSLQSIKDKAGSEEHSPYIGIHQHSSFPALLFYAQGTKIPNFFNNPLYHCITASNYTYGINLPAGTHTLHNLHISVFNDSKEWVSKMKEIGDKFIIQTDMLRLFFLNDRPFLWYNDKRLTPRGIETSFTHKDREYHSYQANWQVKKLSNNILEARGEWEDLPGLIQVWQFELMNNQDIRCEVSLKTEKPGDIKDLEMAKIWLSLDNDYKHWLSAYKEGNFRGKGGIILKDATTKFIGVFNNIKDDNVPPGLFFVLGELPDYSLAQIQHSTNERRLVYWTNLNKNSLYIKHQGYPLFRSYIKVAQSGTELKELIEDQRKKERQRRLDLETKYSLNKDNLKIFLDFGQGRIYWKDQEITDGFGFYTSILAQENWHDSQNVLWEIEKKDDFTLLARGRWINLPLSQIWQVKLKEGGSVEWNIGLEVYEKVKLEEVQANIILTKDYKDASSEILKAVSQNNSLPQHIKFMLKDNHSICHRRAIGKADFLNSKAIVLKYYDILDKYTQPGRYRNYFKGEISIK